MAPIDFSILSSRSFPNKVANSTSPIIKLVTQSSAAFSAYTPSPTPLLTSSTLPLESPILTALPDLLREQFSTIIVDAPTTTYTSYIELNDNAFASEPASLPDSTPISDSYAVETQAPQPNNSGRDIGIVIGCIIGILILGLIGWVYMMKAKRSQRKRRKGKGKEKEIVKETVKFKVKVNKRKHRKHKKHRKTEAKTARVSGGEAPAAGGA
ncbi:uncharacterized protein EAE97_000038 [Botrytis byssoidea]|uniref:Uncharacterized protein n=1 Tax=Botrytis byssoidea TaxID=139641 RepID=A0A9P5M9N6_9HELO|nr:uncharacterized protein EAE97_000038 [Botrytis byssoidea]KAF7954779.1 hypothetical protein EAE97_000038 [Botrytis byssoidea]